MPTASPSKQPKYAQLADKIRQQIESGKLLPGDRIPSFTEMREQHGVSQGTLERVHVLLEEEGLITRLVGRGTFITHPRERAVKGALGFYVSADSRMSAYWSKLLDGVREEVREQDIQIVLLDNISQAGWERVDGVLFGTTPNEGALAQIAASTPCVSLITSLQNVDINWSAASIRKARRAGSVVADDYEGARQATEYLVSLGHERIGCLLSPLQSSATSEPVRLTGYRDALSDAGIKYDKRMVRYLRKPIPNVDFRPAGQENMRHWLAEDWRDLRCTALLTQNDETAIGAMEALREAEYSIPDDISIIGYDGTDICEYSHPQLTSVEVPLTLIAKTGVEVLLALIAGKTETPRHIVLPTLLRARSSVKPRMKP